MKILFCPLTLSDTELLVPFGKLADGSYHTGVDISAEDVYNICNCVIVNIAEDSGKYIVTAQYNADICIRYGNLVSVSVREGQPVRYKEIIGHADQHVHFEYCKRSIVSPFPVRVGQTTYHKVDPTNVVAGDRSEAIGYQAKQDYRLASHPNPDNLPLGMLDEMLDCEG